MVSSQNLKLAAGQSMSSSPSEMASKCAGLALSDQPTRYQATRSQNEALRVEFKRSSGPERLAALRARHPKGSPLSPQHRAHPSVASLLIRPFDLRDEEMNEEWKNLGEWFLVRSSCNNHFFVSVFRQVLAGNEMSGRQARGLVNLLRQQLLSGRWSS